MSRSAVIFDIDGTLADLNHRLHLITGARRDWDAFFAAMGQDTIVEPIRNLARELAGNHAIIVCSGRPDNYRVVTEAWLRENGVEWDALYMRAAGDTRPDHVVKAEILKGMIDDGFEPWLAIDDRTSIVGMWREHRITCLQCREWSEAAPKPSGPLSIMIGPSGAGKSSWLAGQRRWIDESTVQPTAAELGIHPSHIVSSDQIRADLCGDFHCQDRNADVFAALHAQVRAKLSHGLPAVVDATNLRRKDRLSVVDLAPPDGRVRYLVLDRPDAEKRRDAGWRAELTIDLIAKHDQIFRSQIAEILRGDDRPNVEVIDLRSTI